MEIHLMCQATGLFVSHFMYLDSAQWSSSIWLYNRLNQQIHLIFKSTYN